MIGDDDGLNDKRRDGVTYGKEEEEAQLPYSSSLCCDCRVSMKKKGGSGEDGMCVARALKKRTEGRSGHYYGFGIIARLGLAQGEKKGKPERK